MGKMGRAIVGMDVDKLLNLLRKAYSDEWLAYYQYWVGAKVAKGPMKDAIIAELLQHSADELRHADLLTLRIIQLGGTPVTEPSQWYKLTNCGYAAPDDPSVRKLLEQNVEGERCAIRTYQSLLDATLGKDPVTYNLVVQILQDEITHEEDLQALQEDLDVILTTGESVKRKK